VGQPFEAVIAGSFKGLFIVVIDVQLVTWLEFDVSRR
jgi:hypothetical protein